MIIHETLHAYGRILRAFGLDEYCRGTFLRAASSRWADGAGPSVVRVVCRLGRDVRQQIGLADSTSQCKVCLFVCSHVKLQRRLARLLVNNGVDFVDARGDLVFRAPENRSHVAYSVTNFDSGEDVTPGDLDGLNVKAHGPLCTVCAANMYCENILLARDEYEYQ